MLLPGMQKLGVTDKRVFAATVNRHSGGAALGAVTIVRNAVRPPMEDHPRCFI